MQNYPTQAEAYCGVCAFPEQSHVGPAIGGPGIVERGVIAALPRRHILADLGANILVCGAQEMVDRLAGYAELGIDAVITSSNFGQDQAETLELMSRFAQDVMLHLQAMGKAA